MKLKVFVIVVLGLFLSACGGGSGSTTEESNDSNSIPNNNSNNQEADIDIDEAEQYFKLIGSPVTQILDLPDIRGRVYSYQLEEYDNNLNIKLEDGGSTELYSRSPTVNVAEYTPVGSLGGQWRSACINYKEVRTNSNGVDEGVYYSQRIGRFFSEYQKLMRVDFYIYNALDCDAHYLDSNHSYGFSTLYTQSEIVGNGLDLSLIYLSPKNDSVEVELTRTFAIAKDGNSFIMYEGDKTYTVYYK